MTKLPLEIGTKRYEVDNIGIVVSSYTYSGTGETKEPEIISDGEEILIEAPGRLDGKSIYIKVSKERVLEVLNG